MAEITISGPVVIADVIDETGTKYTSEVLARAVEEWKARSRPVMATKDFSGKLVDAQGEVTNLELVGDRLECSVRLFHSDAGRECRMLLEPVIALGATVVKDNFLPRDPQATQEGAGVKSMTVTTVSVIERRNKVSMRKGDPDAK